MITVIARIPTLVHILRIYCYWFPSVVVVVVIRGGGGGGGDGSCQYFYLDYGYSWCDCYSMIVMGY